MKKLLIMLTLIIFTAMTVKTDPLPNVDDFPEYLGSRSDITVLAVNGYEWFQMSQDLKVGYVAGCIRST